MEAVEKNRCPWCGTDPDYVHYHDNEWGCLVTDDRLLFEFLILEGAQAGLSWLIILRRRTNYQKAFAQFNPIKVAQFTDADIARLMEDAGIIRNRLKIQSAIRNAQLFMDVQKEFGSFYNYIFSYFPDKQPLVNTPKTMGEIAISSPISDAISKDMKRRGFKFFGTTICYSFLQATGFVNDHLADCWVKA